MAQNRLWEQADLPGTPVSGDGKMCGGSGPAGREPARQDSSPHYSDSGMPFSGEDLDRFMEMLERSNPRAFRELLEEDPGWA